MPRTPRLDAPGTVHHVWTRGIERRPIFLDDEDREDFVTRLGTVLPSAETACFAWCLMDNHVHLVLQTRAAPLWRILHRLKTGFAVRFNRRHERSGHLFQNRYGSRPVTGNTDLMNLIRYVHLNPIRGGIVGDLAQLARYPWCAHGALTGLRAALPFEATNLALAAFGSDPESARARLREWMELPIDIEPVSAGNEAVSLPDLMARVASDFGVDVGDLQAGRRGVRLSRARAVLCHRAIAEAKMLGRDVARELGLSGAGVCKAAQRGRALLARAESES